eukprot:gnl/TRDRNA2_/TRDRNA2_165372_c0_seq2.p1 gnl/TRDRNA2_/TRDRNA2_165372_c0~~gnl/TRDRNA2_/TRDRNA2_165372_c0_seq2.p1  ORF type:complete len:234 (+),score=21.91 gnl/TRDRNA2_/TRDRNA2_165372_c0_seq2:354-1055(+)
MDSGFEEDRILTRLLLPWTRVCRIYHCRCLAVDPAGSCSHTACQVVGPPASSWNGISTSRDKRKLYVNDIFQRQIHEFRIDRLDATTADLAGSMNSGGAALTWLGATTVDFAGFMDNIDATSGILWAGMFSLAIGPSLESIKVKSAAAYKSALANGTAVPRPYTHISRPTPDAPPVQPVPGGAIRVDLTNGTVTPVIWTSLLWQVSFAGSMDGKVVLGSAFDEGVVVCPEPEN